MGGTVEYRGWRGLVCIRWAIDFTADEFKAMYMGKNHENIERQRRGYTHDVSYR